MNNTIQIKLDCIVNIVDFCLFIYYAMFIYEAVFDLGITSQTNPIN